MSTQNQQIVPFKRKVENIRQLLVKSKDQMAMALPKHMSVDRMLRITMTSIQRTPKLLDCTPMSLLGAVMQAAQLGLEPDGLLGQAHLVPFKNSVTLIPGYKGLIKLARNSGELATIQAHEVHEKDSFMFCYGLDPKLEHIPARDENPGEIIAFYAVARLKDGSSQFEVMWKREVEAIRKQSKAANEGPWKTHYEEMGKKTVLRRLCKMLPSSIEMSTAVMLDEKAEAGIGQDLDKLIELDPSIQEEPASKLDQIVEAEKPKAIAAKNASSAESGEGSDPDPMLDGSA